MPRRYRSVLPGFPHHVIQRGNRRQQVFFKESDRSFYLKMLKLYCKKYQVKIWAYCLMSNHVHLILVPGRPESLAFAVGETHKAYTKTINDREGWKGYLWQGRFLSFMLGVDSLRSVMRYVELNPVRARMVERPEDHGWSSVRGHMGLAHDPFLDECPLLSDIDNWRDFLKADLNEDVLRQMRSHASNGRPFGDKDFLDMVHDKLGIDVAPKKRGPRKKR